MHAWEAVQKSVDWIEENLAEEIAMEKLAEVAALSPFYFQRLFARLVKRPVREYIKLRRLARASKALNAARRLFWMLLRNLILQTGKHFLVHSRMRMDFRRQNFGKIL